MREIIIGVSGINAVDNPGPGVGVARALKEDPDLRVKIVGLAYDAMEPGAYLDWVVDKSYIMPYPSGGHDAYFERLAYIKNSYGMDFLIPNLDAELPIFTKYARELDAMGIQTFLPTHEQYNMRGKDKLNEVAERIHIEYPEFKIVTNTREVHKALEELGSPVMVKGAFYKAYKAGSVMEAVHHFNKIVEEWGYPVIIQKMVSGEEMNVVGVGDGSGKLLGQVAIKKMWVTSLGKIWTGVTIKNDLMLRATADFVREYAWKGPFELECMVDDDKVYLIEINPRFPAWSYFAAGVGINLPALMVKKAAGMPIDENPDYQAGKLFIRYTYETITDMTVFQKLITKGES